MAAKRGTFSKAELYRRGPQVTYKGRNLDEIAFPLGGIGTGCVSLGGWGQLRDWEIMNRPAKGYTVKNGFFAIKVRSGKGKSITKVLQGPVGGTYTEDAAAARRYTGEGFPRFENVKFKGEYPFAAVRMDDPAMPVEVTLEAFNPFIPTNDKDSSIPTAIFLYTVRNTTSAPVDVTLFGNMTNPVGETAAPGGRVSEIVREPGLVGLRFENTELAHDSAAFGSIALAAMWDDVEVQPSWGAFGDGSFFSVLWNIKLWEGLSQLDKFAGGNANPSGTGTVAAHCRIEGRGKVTIPFVLAWHFPTVEHWNKPDCKCDGGCEAKSATWTNWYASQWRDAWGVAAYVAENFQRLFDETALFHDALFSSTLPAYVLDAVSANMSILKTPTCLRLPDGTFYGFEGCKDAVGCCEGSCTHVWNYAQALPYLFPALQRSQRKADYRYAMREDGFVQFRLPLPPGAAPDFKFHAAADGQMGTVMQVYREWLISGDTKWLREMWPKTKMALEFAWKYWDADRDGVMEGMQHNTYDIEFYGPNAMMETLYLGALRAGEEMARIVGDAGAAAEYRKLFEKGSAWTDKHLFNGDYYEQDVRPDAQKAWPEPYRGLSEKNGRDDKFPWPRQQYGKGCISDQMIGQWIAEMLGLGKLLDPKKVRKTLESIFKYNWRADLADHACTLRMYAFAGEPGLLIGSWPRGGRPGYPFIYADEVWCGIEYQVASNMIYEGLVDEGLAITKGVRERHRGDRRNPWDEFECGHHYARSMASYAVMTALAGFSCNMAEKQMGFEPRVFEKNFRVFWSVGSGWGTYEQKLTGKRKTCALDVAYGTLAIKELSVGVAKGAAKKASVEVAGRKFEASLEKTKTGMRIVLDEPVRIDAGQRLVAVIG